MNSQEQKLQLERTETYSRLEKKRDKLYAALEAVTADWKGVGPCDQGPFTGNARESRQVESMHIKFTPTRGGAPAVELEIKNMYIEAYELGNALKEMLQDKIDQINAAMKKI